MDNKPLLKDESVFPSNEVIEATVGEASFATYENFLREVIEGCGLDLEWRFYKDGHVWLGKVTFKKKTVFWLSVWKGFFATTFYFTEKTMTGLLALDIGQKIKEDFCKMKPAGKLLPLFLAIEQSEQIDDLVKIVHYKKSIK